LVLYKSVLTHTYKNIITTKPGMHDYITLYSRIRVNFFH